MTLPTADFREESEDVPTQANQTLEYPAQPSTTELTTACRNQESRNDSRRCPLSRESIVHTCDGGPDGYWVTSCATVRSKQVSTFHFRN